jgi:hypothetical protein
MPIKYLRRAKRGLAPDAILGLLSQERLTAELLRRDNRALIEANDRLRSMVNEQNVRIAQMLVYLDRLKREYLVPPHHESTADDFLRTLFGEGGRDDEA